MEKITIEVYENYVGDLVVTPVSKKHAKKYAKHVQEFTGYYQESILFQDGYAASKFWQHIPKRYHEMLKRGYKARFRVDPWIVGNWYGYDACYVDLG